MSIEIISCIANKSMVQQVLDAGADAIYCGLMNKSWYNNNIELSWEDLIQASETVHKSGKKIYLAVNRDLTTDDVDEVLDHLHYFKKGTLDGIILSDWGCIEAIRQKSTDIHIHLSANTGCVNYWDFNLAKELKVQRIIFSPSLEFEDIREFVKKYKGFEWEAITYGMACFNEVGHCPCIADYGHAKIDNMCRHKFDLYENNNLIVSQKAFGNSLLDGEIAKKYYDIGVTHWKIEGRAKGLQHLLTGTTTLKKIAEKIGSR